MVTFTRSVANNTADVVTSFEAGTTLGSWPQTYVIPQAIGTYTYGDVTLEVSPDTFGLQVISLSLPTTPGVKFVRLKATHSP